MRNSGILALALVVAGIALALPPTAAAHDRSHRHAAHGHVRHLHSRYHHRAAWPAVTIIAGSSESGATATVAVAECRRPRDGALPRPALR